MSFIVGLLSNCYLVDAASGSRDGVLHLYLVIMQLSSAQMSALILYLLYVKLKILH